MNFRQGMRQKRRTLNVEINITPLVDVVLVLLVVLMVVSTYIDAQAMRVELPRATTLEEVNQNPLTLTILRDGRILLNERNVLEADLQEELSLAFRRSPDLPMIISADRAVPHGRVVQFVDVARRVGATRFAIKVEEGL